MFYRALDSLAWVSALFCLDDKSWFSDVRVADVVSCDLHIIVAVELVSEHIAYRVRCSVDLKDKTIAFFL